MSTCKINIEQLNVGAGEMAEELSMEIRKLEVRLKGFLKEEEAFVKELENCLEKFGNL